jgi:hypothetical protein
LLIIQYFNVNRNKYKNYVLQNLSRLRMPVLRHIAIGGLIGSTIFFHSNSQMGLFSKKKLNVKCVF